MNKKLIPDLSAEEFEKAAHTMAGIVKTAHKLKIVEPDPNMVLIFFKHDSLLGDLIKRAIRLDLLASDNRALELSKMTYSLVSHYHDVMNGVEFYTDPNVAKCPHCHKLSSLQNLTGISSERLRIITL